MRFVLFFKLGVLLCISLVECGNTTMKIMISDSSGVTQPYDLGEYHKSYKQQFQLSSLQIQHFIGTQLHAVAMRPIYM